MRIRLLHFASFRDAVGSAEQEREVPEGMKVSELWSALSQEVALFSRFPSMPPAAVNLDYVPAATVLRDGDEVAFLPPVAGG